MTWKADPIKHFLERTRFLNDGREFTSSQEYTPGEYSSEIPFIISKDDVELRIRSYTLEHLKQAVKIDYSNGVVNELFVGIRNGTSIQYVGELSTTKEFESEKIKQYFFKNDEPSAFNLGFVSGPGWPLNQPAFIDDKLWPYFTELKTERPNVIPSLEKCMIRLTTPGPKYTGQSEDGIKFKLKR